MVYTFVGVFVVLLSVVIPISMRACATGRVSVNSALGLRTQYVMASTSTWKAGHKAALPAIYIGCGAALIAALGSFDPGLPIAAQVSLQLGGVGAILASVLISVPFANRAALDVIAAEHPEK